MGGPYRIVLLRHGESIWNKENRFTGWTDVGLTADGVEEARQAGRLLKAEGFIFDRIHTSVLSRAIETNFHTLSEMDLLWLPSRKDWRLNERHYGALQGLNKKETAEKYGAEQVFEWRRSYDVPPPPLDLADERHPRHDPRYADVPDDDLPGSECLADVVARMLPYWFEAIVPDIKAGDRVLISAHGNSLRGLVKHLDRVSDQDIPQLNIPTGIPLVYELDEDLVPVSSGYLGDEEAARTAAEAVAKQAG